MTVERAKGSTLEISASGKFYIFTSYLWHKHVDAQGSISYGNHYFLPYHRDRLISAAQSFGWAAIADSLNGEAGLELLSSLAEQHLGTISDTGQVDAVRKIKISLYRDNNFTVESAAITPTDMEHIFPLPTDLNSAASLPRRCIVKLNSEVTVPSMFTTHKTSERSPYDRARIRTGVAHEPPTTAEVLLFNPQDEIMECSLSTPYFLRDAQWVTPPLSSGGHAGVTRRLALERGLCREQIIPMGSLRNEEAIWISNGVRGFIPATISSEVNR